MAKNQAATKPEVPAYIPEGLRRTTGDVIGFHDLEDHGPIYGIPMAAKLSDSKLEPSKPSCFIIFKIVADPQLPPCLCYEGSGDDQQVITAKEGDLVGVWTKPGMRPIFQACGRKVFMSFAGEKKLRGRPEAQSPMKVYDCHISDGPNRTVPLIEDNRIQSIGAKTPWHKEPLTAAARGKTREPGEDDDDFGF